MAAPSSVPSFPFTPKTTGTEFSSADTTTKKVVHTAGAAGSRVLAIRVCSNDSADRDLAFWFNDGTMDHYLGNVHVPLGSGYTTVAVVDGLAPIAEAGLDWLELQANYTLKANLVATMTASDTINVVCMAQDF